MPREITLSIQNRFQGFHRWKDAPEKVKFLRFWHRHEFWVTTFIRVEGDNREVEFFIVQEAVQKFLDQQFAGQYFEYSCEQLATMILDHLQMMYANWKVESVEVLEDGENGACVTEVTTVIGLEEVTEVRIDPTQPPMPKADPENN